MGNTLCYRSNRVGNGRARMKDSQDEENSKDRFSTDHEVRVPVDYPSKTRRPLSISLRSIGSFRIRKDKGTIRKTTSLQSAVSVHIDPEVEKLRKDFEQYKSEKISEISLLSRQCELTFNENRRLRGELKLLQSTCAKLKHERDRAQMAERDALERSSAIETERDKVQRQFKLFRDTKANELQTLLKEKHQLETRLNKYINVHELESDSNTTGHDFLGEGGEIMGNITDLSNFAGPLDNESTDLSNHLVYKGIEHSHFGNDTREPFTNLKKGDWNSVVQNLVKSLNASIMSIPENNVYKVYIAATLDMEEEAKLLYQKHLSLLRQHCEFEGRFLLPIHIPHENWMQMSGMSFNENLANRMQLVETSDIFICLLGSEVNSITIEDIKKGLQRQSGIKHSVFCVKGNEKEKAPDASIDDELWQSIVSGKRTKIQYFDKATASSEICAEAAKVLGVLIMQFLKEQPNYNLTDQLFPSDEEDWCVGCGWDSFSDYEQSLALKYNADENMEAIGLQQYFDQLNEHIAYHGPVQPLLITGDKGAGKSFLLARWIQMQQANLHGGSLLYHFVGSQSTFSADSVQVLRRLTIQLMLQLPSTCNPSRLEEEFPKWLEKVSSRLPCGIIIVIDNADNLMGLSSYMKWLVDPLPVGCRVIISVGSDNYPKSWRSWPKLNVRPFSNVETRQFLQSSWKNDLIAFSPDMMDKVLDHFNENVLQNPLCLTLLNKQLESCNSYQEISSEMAKFQSSTEISDFYLVLIEELESCYGVDTLRNVLCHIYLSRNGLSESEIMQLFNIPWLSWVRIHKELINVRICRSGTGFLAFANSQARAAVDKYYALAENQSMVIAFRQNMIDLFRTKNIPGQVPYRVADELPWLLVQTGQLGLLKEVIQTMCIFVRLYRKGRCAELITYWKCINCDVLKMAESYYDFIKMLEKDPNFGPRAPILYDILGRFLRELGLLSQALRALERSLELRESSLDPDHPSIGQSFHHLGGLYTQWRKYGTAETMYKQALEIKENAYESDHPSVAKELEALAVLYLLQEKTGMAEPLKKRSIQIYQKYYREQSSNSSQEVLNRCAEEIVHIAKVNNSAEIAKSLNDLGVLFFIQNNHTLAKSFFNRALEIRESLLGSDHVEVAQSLHNLAALYNDQKLFKQAEDLYEKALSIRSNAFPVENSSVQSTLRHLAALYRKQGKYAEAEKLYRQILESREKSLGENHPGLATTVNNLAVLLCHVNKRQEAIKLFERAIKLYEEHLGIQHVRVSEILQNMAKLYLDAGDTQEATRLFKQALDQNRTSYQPPLRLPKRGQPSRNAELDSKTKDYESRRSSFSSIVHIPKS